MDLITEMNTYLQEQERSKMEELAQQRAFSLLILKNLKASVQRVENDIARFDNKIAALTEQDEKKQEVSKFNRSMVIDLADKIPTTALSSMITNLEDEKKQLEKNLNALERGQAVQISTVKARIVGFTERIKIYGEAYQNRTQFSVIDTDRA
jgi:cysteinyl-tRNA synthetase